MPLINNCYGYGKSSSVPQLCDQVDNFTAGAGMLTALLTWSAPTIDEDSSFVGTRIVRKVGSVPKNKSDGTVVYEGTELTYTDTGLTEGTTYYYRAFAYNEKKKYQTALCMASMTAIPVYDTFSDNDWDTIIASCRNGVTPSTWAVGDNKTMMIDGEEHQIDIIGKKHDSYTNGGTAPLTFQLHRCLDKTHAWVRNYDDNISIMPTNVQNAIRSVSKPTAGSYLQMKLFLLSEDETIGTHQYAEVAEGIQYEYYSAGNSRVKIRKNDQGSSYISTRWWLRSKLKDYDNYGFIDQDGNRGGSIDHSYGISFGFCF